VSCVDGKQQIITTLKKKNPASTEKPITTLTKCTRRAFAIILHLLWFIYDAISISDYIAFTDRTGDK
jgi:hypothetical protein